MHERRRLTCAALFLAPVAIACAPSAAADPFPPVGAGQSASATIDDLQSQGYTVQINWVNGFDTKPLSQCQVTGINDPSHSAPADGAFTPVYVDVACPNGDDSGFTFGGGLG